MRARFAVMKNLTREHPWISVRGIVGASVRLKSADALAEALQLHDPPEWRPDAWSPEFAAMLARGVVRRGAPGRLLSAMRKARRGEPVVVVGVGSSLAGINGGAVGAIFGDPQREGGCHDKLYKTRAIFFELI